MESCSRCGKCMTDKDGASVIGVVFSYIDTRLDTTSFVSPSNDFIKKQ